MSESENRQLKKTIGLRVSEAEYDEISVAALERGLTRSAYARLLVLGEEAPLPRRRRQLPARIPADELARLLGQFGKIGSNLNQLAHRANAEKKHACTQALKDELEALAPLRAQLQALLGGGSAE